MKKALGLAMMATPFVGAFVYAVASIGLLNALLAFGLAALLVIWIIVGVELLG